MRFDIRYRTAFEYENVIRHSQNELRACPASDEFQQLISYRVSSSPSAAFNFYTDYWGTRVDTYGIRDPHVALELIAEASIETKPRPMVSVSPTAEQLREPEFLDPLIEYLGPTRHTMPGDGVKKLAHEIYGRNSPDAAGVLMDIHRTVHRVLEYVPGETAIGIDVESVLDGGKGVCQDYAHLAVALCREVGIPARYVSGYFFAADDRTGDVDSDVDMVEVATHAWFEAALPGHGWFALDPTNALRAGERHVTIGRGREYDDVPPVRGVYAGTATAIVDAKVQIRRLNQAQQQQQ